MKYKTLFRILMKALGVLFFFGGIESVCRMGVYLVAALQQSSTVFGPYQWTSAAASLFPGLMQIILGFYLFFGGRWIVNKAIPSNRPYCTECGYDVTAGPSVRCPECGTVLPEEVLTYREQYHINRNRPGI